MSQVRTARAVASELGRSAAIQGGVQKWANITLHNSERDVHSVVGRQDLRLNIPLTRSVVQGEEVLWIRPSNWLRYIVNKGLWPRLSGAVSEDRSEPPSIWSFWTQFRKLHPDFNLFRMQGVDLSHTAACYVHGDEGRTLKKLPIMITQLQSCLGAGFAKQQAVVCSFVSILQATHLPAVSS